MGYSMPGDKEIYTLDEIIAAFDPKRIGVSGAFFDVQKLDWVNQQYLINSISEKDLWERMKQWSFNDAFMQKLMPLCHTRIKTFGDFMDLAQFFFINNITYTDALLCPRPSRKSRRASSFRPSSGNSTNRRIGERQALKKRRMPWRRFLE